MRQSVHQVGVSEVDMVRIQSSTCTKGRGVRPLPHPSFNSHVFSNPNPLPGNYLLDALLLAAGLFLGLASVAGAAAAAYRLSWRRPWLLRYLPLAVESCRRREQPGRCVSRRRGLGASGLARWRGRRVHIFGSA